MKPLLFLGIFLLMTSQLGAETYSWVDDSGTYNFTEDLSSVPKKYQKKVKRIEDVDKDSAPQVSAPPEKKSDPSEVPVVKPASAPVEDKELYNGKSRDAWRLELDAHEAELKKLEQHLEQLHQQSTKEPRLARDQFAILKKDYDDTKAAYDQKYKVYNELIESARKAGLTVNIKK